MIDKFVELLVELFKDKAWWPFIRPVFQVVVLYVVTTVIAYQYIEWRYHFTPELATFLHSYIVKQISVVFLTLVLLVYVFGLQWKSAQIEAIARLATWVRSGAKTLVVAGIIVVFALTIFLRLMPHSVSHIQIQFIEEPKSFDQYAFAYIVYELNRFQTEWHFTLNADTRNPAELSTTDEACGKDKLCYANLIAENQPFIGIVESGFEQDSFWINSDAVSVISAGQWKRYEPPSIYDYLSHVLIVQSMLIHLNQSCGGVPSTAFKASRFSYGDLFEFVPRRNQMRVAILAAHLSPKGEELLANCFGLEYMNLCNQLLSLGWLHSGRVHENLEKTFGVKL
jgi:hypothetical protein